MDIEMKEMDGIEATKAIYWGSPHHPMIITLLNITECIFSISKSVESGYENAVVRDLDMDSFFDLLREFLVLD